MQLWQRLRLHLTVSCRVDRISERWTGAKLGAVRTVGSRPLANVASRALEWPSWAAARWCAGPGQRQSALTSRRKRRQPLGIRQYVMVYSVQIRYLLLVGTGMLELLGWRALVREVSYAWQKHAFMARIKANEDKEPTGKGLTLVR